MHLDELCFHSTLQVPPILFTGGCIAFLEARGRPGNHSSYYRHLATDRFPDESERWLFYREPTLAEFFSLHFYMVVLSSVELNSLLNLYIWKAPAILKIFIIRDLSAGPTAGGVSQLPETTDTLSLKSLRKACSIKMRSMGRNFSSFILDLR